ncbi:unnamed protein product [Chironomus riparius]|uniref:Uncharacterized protein n=1 Tax=Chironomus riparius TaxID=315576 RepID=A0A9P0IYH1_9DIPT|nr:unnamed protein product [Chironomus riparius]
MFKQNLKAIFVLLIIQNANSAMKKSWKSSANFASNFPKLSPFENSVLDVETEEPPVPSTKISAKLRSQEKHFADLYNSIKDSQRVAQDFGSFAYQVPQTSSEEEELDNKIPSKLLNYNLSDENEDDDNEEFDLVRNDETTEYNLGQLMNVSINSNENTVRVKLDQKSLKDIFTGRGRKHNMMERVAPLFVLPFLIQAAVIPFMLTTIKLFLMKSLFAGKIAILFFLLGALKSHQNSIYMKSLQNPPLFLKDYPSPYLPERRVETSYDGYKFDGYKVDGKPEAFIN